MAPLLTRLGWAVLIVVATAGCGGAQSPAPRLSVPATASGQPSPSGTPRTANWPSYHGNPRHTGAAAGLPPAGPLSPAWTTRLDGQVAGQPLVIGGTVIAATEADTVYGLSRATGRIEWHTQVGHALPLAGQPCGNLNPLGITSTPVYDRTDGLVYVVAEDAVTGYLLAGLRVSDGRQVVTRDIPAPDHEPGYDQQRGALAIDGGYVDVVFGGHAGDCGPYIGSIVAVPASGRGPILQYLIPTPRQGGIWAAGGPVVAPSGAIYISVGNGGRTSPPFDGSESVTELTPTLHPVGLFAPADWPALNASDSDLGSASPALLGDGTILQVGKSGTGYLLDAAHLGGVGGQIAQQQVCHAFGGPAVTGTVVYVPCYGTGLTAVNTAGSKIGIVWRSPADVWGSPVTGGGAVFVAQPRDGVLYELSPRTGAVRYQLSIAAALPHFVSPSLSGDLVLVGTLTGVTAVRGA